MKCKGNKITFQIIEKTPPEEFSFDIETWLADLLVDYWYSQNKSHQKGGLHEE